LLKVITGSFCENSLRIKTAEYFLISLLFGLLFYLSNSIARSRVSSIFLTVMLPPDLAKFPKHSAPFSTVSWFVFVSSCCRTSGISLLTYIMICVSWEISRILLSARKIPSLSCLFGDCNPVWNSLKISSVSSGCFYRYSNSLWEASSWTCVFLLFKVFQILVSSMFEYFDEPPVMVLIC